MLMVAILQWGKELMFRRIESVQYVHDLKRRHNWEDTEFIIHDSTFLCPIKLDNATRELAEDEVLEFKMSEAYPQLEAEGRLIRKNGKYKNPRKIAQRVQTI
jgi:hypothetical protein